MEKCRNGVAELGGKRVLSCLDYSLGLDGLPKSDVLKFILEDNCSIVVRPSGTEPKLKTYFSISAESKEQASEIEKKLVESTESHFGINKR
jgi:phosphoglucomutase